MTCRTLRHCLTCQYFGVVAFNGNGDPEVREFMRRVMEELDVDTADQLADLLTAEHLFRASELRKMHRWVTGENAPNHHATMRLLRRAGFLNGI